MKYNNFVKDNKCDMVDQNCYWVQFRGWCMPSIGANLFLPSMKYR